MSNYTGAEFDTILARHQQQRDEERFRELMFAFCAGMVAATLIFVAAI